MSERLHIGDYIPELDGLRGLAIGAVLLYHCHEKLMSSHLDHIARGGWAGVNLFFVLSGFLITGIIVDSRNDPYFFRNFYARRGLRIWPVYFLVLLLVYFVVPFAFGNFWWALHEFRSAPWWHYLLFVQNLLFYPMPGTIGPTWSLAIEEQYYVFWAPIARFMRNTALLPMLVAVFLVSPFIRLANTGFLTPAHTLTHLDGLAIGSMIALAYRTYQPTIRTWWSLAACGLAMGAGGVVLAHYRGSAFTDTLFALGFGGMLIAALLVSGRNTWYGRFLTFSPLKYLGKVSYGLYLIHILCFVVIGAFDLKMAQYGMWGDLAVVAVRMVLSILAATALWYGFERPILRLKKFFMMRTESPTVSIKEAVVAAD
ncbi:MAG TPA: acyltransferase [Terriglobales bacterium]